MTKAFLPGIILFCLASVTVAGQNNHAVICLDQEVFTMKNVSSGSLTVKRVVDVLDIHGKDEAIFYTFTDKSTILSSFSAIVSKDGKTTRVGKNDLSFVSLATGLAEDSFVTAYSPDTQPPYRIEYNYIIQYKKGFAVFPFYSPVQSEKSACENGSYTIEVPDGTRIAYRSNIVGEPECTDKNGIVSYKWAVSAYPGYVSEHKMPSRLGLVPWVQASPEEFMFDGVNGNQSTWERFGQWQYSLLEGTDDLPEQTVALVADLTRECSSDTDKVRNLYEFLGDKTRYVSIQFGIGGFKPFRASLVDKTGFGDCKALTNYMRCLLRSAGIESEYAVLNTNRAFLDPDYASVGQTNHAMLCVPVEKDTLWLECTNPSYPFGYRHSDVAGHNAIIINSDGGHLVKVASYPDSLSKRCQNTTVVLYSDGSASLKVNKKDYLDYSEDWIGFSSLSEEKKMRILMSGADVQPQDFSLDGISDNFKSYDGDPMWTPNVSIDYSFNVRAYSGINGTRMTVMLNPFSKKMQFQRGKRQNRIVTAAGTSVHDTVRYVIPDGYVVESLPQDVVLDGEFGSFESTCRSIGNTVLVRQTTTLKPCDLAPSEYDKYREFIKTLNKTYSSYLVLVKSD
ncbi:MAG: DUF3857 domain-containing protein [Bacteroidales bacterium]|nr:DUF3857 domain-containing protein [Bacteroidales bacterium]